MNLSDSDEEGETSGKDVKVVLLGDTAVGKTSLRRRLCGDSCPMQHVPTQGVEFGLKRTTLAVPSPKNGTQAQFVGPAQPVPVTAELWDVAGDALDGGMIEQYIFGAQVVLLVFDIASTASLEGLTEWLDCTRKVSAHMEQRPLVVVIANKHDLEHERAVRYERQLRFVHENGLSFHCVSAKTGENIEMCFQKILADLLGVRLMRMEPPSLPGGTERGPAGPSSSAVSRGSTGDLNTGTEAAPKLVTSSTCSLQ